MIHLVRYCLVFGVAGLVSLPAVRADEKKEEKKGVVVEIDGLKSAVPAEWEQQKVSSQFRIYHFRIPHVADDKRDAEMIVFYFAGGGGSADANIKRWKGMFIPPDGKKIDDVAKVENFKVGDVNVTYLDIEGTYRFKERPDPAAKEESCGPITACWAWSLRARRAPIFSGWSARPRRSCKIRRRSRIG